MSEHRFDKDWLEDWLDDNDLLDYKKHPEYYLEECDCSDYDDEVHDNEIDDDDDWHAINNYTDD